MIEAQKLNRWHELNMDAKLLALTWDPVMAGPFNFCSQLCSQTRIGNDVENRMLKNLNFNTSLEYSNFISYWKITCDITSISILIQSFRRSLNIRTKNTNTGETDILTRRGIFVETSRLNFCSAN